MPRSTPIPILLILLSLPALSATIHVPGDQPTIQAGVDAASAGDVVEVACGTYFESSIVMKSGVTLTSETGLPECVTVDAEKNDRVFYCEGTDDQTIVTGLTVKNGGEDSGSGMWCRASDMTISRCAFVDNDVIHDGGAIVLAAAASPLIVDCTFIGNRTVGKLRFHNRGAAIYMWNGCTPTIENCTFSENSALFGGAVWGGNQCSPVITDCSFYGNSGREGGAILLEGGSSFDISGCLFLENEADEGGAILVADATGSVSSSTFHANLGGLGAHAFVRGASAVSISASILAFGTLGGSVICAGTSLVTLDCCDVYGNVGGNWLLCLLGQENANGNFSQDPLFCDASSGDLNLRSSSPCAPPGVTGCGLVGALGVGCGPVSVIEESWTGIKGRYR